MDATTVASLFAVTAFVLAHIFAGQLHFLHVIPRSRWLSFAGGVSVAYVFVHLLPELTKAQITLADATVEMPALLENHVYLVALAGLIVYYGLERLAAKLSPKHNPAEGIGLFWLHIISFAFYNGLIGYLLLHREEQGLKKLIFYSIAMLLHFIVNDYGLRERYQEDYQGKGRWVLTVAIVLGWIVGLTVEVSKVWVAVLLAFLAGGVIMNVLKEELPEERESRFSAFLLGAVAYTVLLLTF